ncbi:hypothetical protein BURK2_01395 [Burkholderiales bacterium]|nr:MAG: hypothetical protein F9K47_16355 [Burkholderiales bacterium]CAG0972815.1 hypothetical protein BURK2_01395 [Burkholderiales bacterium]
MQRAAPLRLQLQGSPALAAVFLALHGATAVLPWLLPGPAWVRGALCVAVLGQGAWAIWAKALRRARGELRTLEIDREGNLLLEQGDGRRKEARVLPGSLVLPFLVMLSYRILGERRSRRLVLTPDAAGAEAFRKLRIRLRHPRAAAAAQGAAAANSGRR